MVGTLKNSMYAALVLMLALSVQSQPSESGNQEAVEEPTWFTLLGPNDHPGEPLHTKGKHGLAVAEVGKDLLSSPTKKKNKASPCLSNGNLNSESQILATHDEDNLVRVARAFAQPLPRGPPQAFL